MQLTDEQKSDIQGIVTSGYAHLPHAEHVGVRFESAAAGRQWLSSQLDQITSARGWRPAPGQPKQPPERTLHIGLTSAGLAALDLDIAAFPEAFREGMAARASILGDDPRDRHVPDFDALAISYSSDARPLIAEGAREVFRETGARPETSQEPFGFRDGMGQPQIAGVRGRLDDNTLPTGEFILGYEDHYGFLPAGPAITRNGSYAVYRKLEQDVPAFWNSFRAEARQLGDGTIDGIIALAAKAVGRWPSGAPLTLSPDLDRPDLARANNFGYAQEDPDGHHCPFGAHIRRTNPRDKIRPINPKQSRRISNAHRILRRASSYGPPRFPLEILLDRRRWDEFERLLPLSDDTNERGIHFLAVNASIERGFELIQQQWVNNPAFNGVFDNADPILAANTRLELPAPNQPPRRTGLLPQFVTPRGGAYLFLPSLTALRELAVGDQPT